MNFKFLKAAFTSLIIVSSSIASAAVVDFSALNESDSFNAATNQTVGSFSVIDDILTLDHNSWFYIDVNDVIRDSSVDFSNTTLSFDFMASGTPEIGGIQVSNSTRSRNTNIFNLVGTQGLGINDFSYDTVNDWVHFDIDLSDFLTGTFSRITFINDCDNCAGLDVDVSFRNLTFTNLTESTSIPEPSTLAIFALGLFGFAARKMNKKS